MIQTETTPNPESLKFLSENIISAIGTEEFQKNEINKVTNPFIKELLGFKGVELVLLSKNFLSVKKTKNILKKGTEKASIIAEENLKNIREKVGLI